MEIDYQRLSDIEEEVVGSDWLRNCILVLILVEIVYPGTVGWAAAAIFASMVLALWASIAAGVKVNGLLSDPEVAER